MLGEFLQHVKYFSLLVLALSVGACFLIPDLVQSTNSWDSVEVGHLKNIEPVFFIFFGSPGVGSIE